MLKIIPIVEGPGDEAAVPALLWKLLTEMGRYDIQIGQPQKANGCGNLTTPGGIERFVQNDWTKQDCGAVLILMDADKLCPVELAQNFSKRILAIGVRFPVVIAVAKCEYEAWFLASLETIAGANLGGKLALPAGLVYTDNVESRAWVKGWLTEQFPPGRIYKETFDQEPMTKLLDLERVRQRSRSFRRLCHALDEAVSAIDGKLTIVTPAPSLE
jgi:hypothetical protein